MSSKMMTQEEFVKRVYILYGTEYTVVGQYTGIYNKVEILHNTCGKISNLSANTFLQNKSHCLYCYTKHKETLIGFNDIHTTNPILFSMLKNKDDGYKYREHSNKFVDWICPNCGNIINHKKINDVNRKGLSCNKCGDGFSYPSKIVYSILSQINIEFETEKPFDWCVYTYKNILRKGYYDFYLTINNQPYIIEVDGRFHTEDNSISKQTKEDSHYIDVQKENLAISNGIKVIRIKADKSIFTKIKNNILSSNLNSVLDLSNINWDDCHKYALSSDVIAACNYYNEGINIQEISKLIHKCDATIVNYLKKGSIIEYCNYDPIEALEQHHIKVGIRFSKPVICIETEQYFTSATDAGKFYGVCNSCISGNINGFKKSSCKLGDTKLHWRYATEDEIILHNKEGENN